MQDYKKEGSVDINLNVNGRNRSVTCRNATLIEVLREQLNLTGAHIGCDTVSVVRARCISTGMRLRLARY